MTSTPAIPLVILLVTGGFVAVGVGADVAALGDHLDDLVAVEDPPTVEVAQAHGEASQGTLDRLFLDIETRGSDTIELANLTVEIDEETSALAAIEPVRDEDGSLDEGVLDGDDRARLIVEPGPTIRGGEDHPIQLGIDGADPAETVLQTPGALEDGYNRLTAGS